MKRKSRKKRIAALLLSVVMTVAAIPVSPLTLNVHAAEDMAVLEQKEPMTISEDTTLRDVEIKADPGTSAIVIKGNVALTIEGTVRLTGGDALPQRGGGAGIEVPAGSALTLKGSGTLYAAGGKGANGEDGENAKEEEIIIYTKGHGGGGAGAGIGGKGANIANDMSSVGSITIADKNLAVYANGGSGGERGGKGGNGSKSILLNRDWWTIVLNTHTEEERRGGNGGQGGGGAGFPAAGIGSGGAAGGDGGWGNSGTKDDTICEVLTQFIYPYYIAIGGWMQYAGGAGGGGGAGYVPGGGGGAGATEAGSFTCPPEGSATPRLEPKIWIPGGAGGESGKPGEGNSKESFEYEGKTVVCPKPGKAGDTVNGGAGGTAGSAFSGSKNGGAGEKGGNAGRRGMSGSFTLLAGNVSAKSGGGNAKNIGCGDGVGKESGTAVLKGGNLTDTADGQMTVTNGAEPLYPVQLRPARYQAGVDTAADLVVDGMDAGAGRFLEESGGTVTLWLPNRAEPYLVEYLRPVKTEYEVTVQNGVVTTKLLTEVHTEVDLSVGDVVFHDTYYEQKGNTGAYTENTALVYGGKSNVSYQPGTGEHTLILQNTEIDTLNISDAYGKKAQVIVQSEGDANAIGTIHVVDPGSRVRFTGDVNSRLQVALVNGYNKEETLTGSLNNGPYIKEIALFGAKMGNGGWGQYDEVMKLLEAQGYTSVKQYIGTLGDPDSVDLNYGNLFEGKDPTTLILGYKTTYDPNEAITNVVMAIGKDWKNKDTLTGLAKNSAGKFVNVSATKIKCFGKANGDLNQGNGGEYLYLGTTKSKDFKPITGIGHVRDYYSKINDSMLSNNDCDCNYDWVRFLGKDEVRANTNKGAGSDYYDIAIAISRRNTAGNPALANTYSKDFHPGSVVMDSKGIVQIGRIGGYINFNNDGETYSYLPLEVKSRIYGTPSVEVNTGFLRVENPYPDWQNFQLGRYTSGSVYCDIHNGPVCDKAAKEYSSILHYSNTLGNITVNGGTLEIGKNGTGSFAIPDELKLMVNYRNYIIDLKDIVRPNLTVKTGGSFLCTDALSLDTKYLKTVTGLPANKHLVLLCDPAGNAVGGYENKDIWTNDNGNFTTYVRPEDNGKTLTIADLEAGVRYTYTIICTEDTVDLIREEESSNTLPGGNIDLYKHFYTYETAQVKDYDDSASLIVEQDLQRFRVMQNTQTVLESTAVRQIEKLTGQGEITLRGAGFTLADVADVSKLTVESGTIEMPSAASSLTILGGSVKTDQPLLGVQGATGAVYQAVLPLWSTEVSVDGAAYPGLSGTAHADGRTYLYVPADTKLIEAGGRTFFAFFDSESQTVLLKERLNGDGKIDLTVGSAEILDNDLYIYNGVFYKNTNGTTYEVIGTSEENTLAVTKGNVDITLTDVNVANEKGSPVEFAEGVNAVLHLEGENTLTGGDKMPAIHVPEGAKLTVTGEGVLNAAAGLGAAVIGGGRMEKNGEITVDGGTFNLTDNQAAAIGAGAGAETPENSIIVNGGSLKTAGAAGVFGTVPVNADGEGLNRVIVPGESSAAVKVDGNEYHVSYPNDDGRLYLYMVSDRHTVVVGTTDYLVVPLKATVIGAGTAAFTLVEQDGTSVKLQNGDMLVEGSVIRATTKAEPGYGLSEGLNSGTYLLKNENDRLMFIPVSGELNSAYWNGWSAVVEDNTVKYYEAPVEKVLQQMVGVSTQGEEVFICRAAGEGLTMELLIEGQPVSKTVLGSEMQDITYEWDSAGGEGVTLRFTGTGTVALEKLYVSAKADVSNVQIVFEKAYTITLVQPDNTAEDDGGFIELLDENGRRLKDRNPSEPGEQVLTGEKVQVIYRDYDGGSIFDSFTLASGDSKVEKTANPLVLTAGEGDFAQNIAVSVTAHAQPYYVVVIPETVAVNKEGTAVAEITARELKNMQTGDTLDITIHGLNEDGNAVLTRMGANNTLLIPVTDASFAAFAEESLVAQFTENNLTPFFGGKICFGKPIGRQKAGQYTGNLIFKITYQTTRE